MKKWRYAGFCERGMKRKNNQDAIGIFQAGERGLFFVSDGIGGHFAGEKASGAIKAALAGWWQHHLSAEGEDFQTAIEQIQKILTDTHTQIQKETENKGICGATIVLLLIDGQRYALLWSGDSRCYMLEHRLIGIRMKQITIDDTWENHYAINLAPEEKKQNPFYGKLLQAVGVGEEFLYHLQTGEIKGHTSFILCSDGVYKYVDSEKLKPELKTAMKKDSLESCIGYIRDMVYENHAPDNLSCVMIDIFS